MGAVEIIIPYVPREPFLPFHERKKRWSCLVAHRRAGKTVAKINDLIRGAVLCQLPRPRFAYIAPFRDQAKRVAWDYLKYYSRPLWDGGPNESELSVHLLGERKISLFGADNADALRGIYLDGADLDEFGDFRPGVWGNVIRPALADRKGWASFGGTPKGRNEFWEIREIARKDPENWFLLELRASTSGLLDKNELEDARKQLTTEQYAQEFECDFSAALPGAYFGKELVIAEREGRIGRVEYDAAVPVYTAWDIGYRDDTAIWWFQVVQNEIHVLDYHASSGQTIDYYAKLVATKPYRYKTHWLPHDARAKTLASGGKSIIEQLGALLDFKTLDIVPNLEVQDGIQAARKAIGACWFDDMRCSEGLEALRQYQREYDEDKKAFREKPRHDWTSHPADAFRMLAVAWRKDERVVEVKEEPRTLLVGPQNKATLNDMWRVQRNDSRRY
jgi:phage terminase large subunit